MDRSLRYALLGWAAVLATIVTYDVWAIHNSHVTLSSSCWQLKQHPVGKVVVFGTWLGLTWHMLAGDRPYLPERYHAVYVTYHPVHRAWQYLQPLRESLTPGQ